MSRGLVPFQQGDFTGLCGVYSIINAIHILNVPGLDDEELENLFRHLLLAISDRFPHCLWNGTFPRDQEDMMNAACEWIYNKFRVDISWEKPFDTVAVGNITKWFNTLRDGLDDYSIAIIGLSEPYSHWTVGFLTTKKTLVFYDSGVFFNGNKLKRVLKKQLSISKGQSGKMAVDVYQTYILRKT